MQAARLWGPRPRRERCTSGPSPPSPPPRALTHLGASISTRRQPHLGHGVPEGRRGAHVEADQLRLGPPRGRGRVEHLVLHAPAHVGVGGTSRSASVQLRPAAAVSRARPDRPAGARAAAEPRRRACAAGDEPTSEFCAPPPEMAPVRGFARRPRRRPRRDPGTVVWASPSTWRRPPTPRTVPSPRSVISNQSRERIDARAARTAAAARAGTRWRRSRNLAGISSHRAHTRPRASAADSAKRVVDAGDAPPAQARRTRRGSSRRRRRPNRAMFDRTGVTEVVRRRELHARQLGAGLGGHQLSVAGVISVAPISPERKAEPPVARRRAGSRPPRVDPAGARRRGGGGPSRRRGARVAGVVEDAHAGSVVDGAGAQVSGPRRPGIAEVAVVVGHRTASTPRAWPRCPGRVEAGPSTPGRRAPPRWSAARSPRSRGRGRAAPTSVRGRRAGHPAVPTQPLSTSTTRAPALAAASRRPRRRRAPADHQDVGGDLDRVSRGHAHRRRCRARAARGRPARCRPGACGCAR